MAYGDSVRLGVMSDSMIAPRHTVIATAFTQQVHRLATAMAVPHDHTHATVSSSTSLVYQLNIPPDEIVGAHRSNSPVTSASEELRRLTSSSPELNVSMSSSSDISRPNSPLSSINSQTVKEENAFPFAD
jgi:predicted HAD superfamily phosphohydrolase